MLHGWGASIYMFRHAFEHLPESGARTIAADLRGYGLSDKPLADNAYSLKAFCADLDALLDALELPRVALVGQSMGGGLALRYALREPERVSKLVLINPTGLVAVPHLDVLRFVPPMITDLMGPRLVPRWAIGWILRRLAYGDPTLVTERDIDEYWAPSQLAGYVHAARATLGEFDWSLLSDAEASALAVPTLVLLGKQDQLLPNTTQGAARLNGSVVEWVPGGHCAHEEHPELVYARVSAFIR
jgi:pimeloyl-ACP methyl ester carboxylesterase